jgi:hypothetical protein
MRLTNAFSKKIENHAYAVAIYFMQYSFVRIHQTLKISSAMAAGVTGKLWEMSDMMKVLKDWKKMAAVDKASLVLELWRLRCLRSSRLFYIASEQFGAREKYLTLGNLASSIFVLLFSLSHSLINLDGDKINFVIALASAVVVITSASQYFLDYGKTGIEYGEAGARYAAMNRAIERLTANSPAEPNIEAIQKQSDELGKTTPVLPSGIWKRAATLNQQIENLENDLSLASMATKIQTEPLTELAAMVINLTGSRARIVHRPLPQDDPRQRQPDISNAQELLSWAPRVDLKDGLKKTIVYFEGLLSEKGLKEMLTLEAHA